MPIIFNRRVAREMDWYANTYSSVGDVFDVDDSRMDQKIATWAIGIRHNRYKTQLWHHGCDQWVEYPSVTFTSLDAAVEYVSRWMDAVTLAGRFVDHV